MTGPAALRQLRTANLTYREVGQTRGRLPPGYHHMERRRTIGHGSGDFHAAVDVLMRWGLHRRAGLTVSADADEAAPDVNVILGIGFGTWRLRAPCRVVYIVDEPDRRGFAYGTLPGHPESREERFVAHRLADDSVELEITAFSRPATWWSRIGRPIGVLTQAAIARRYLRALSESR